MAEDSAMTPVVAGEGGEPPKVSASTMPTTAAKPTVKLKPVIKPTTPGLAAPTATLKPGLKLPSKPTIGGLKPGLKLPPKPTIGAIKPAGIAAPATVAPGAAKPTLGGLKPAAPIAGAAPGAAKPTLGGLKPAAPLAGAAPGAAKPPLAGGIKPPTIGGPKPAAGVVAPPKGEPLKPTPPPASLKPVAPASAAATSAAPAISPVPPKPISKSATANLKSVTGPIPTQGTLHKTGIIAEGILTPAQQQAAKTKTARIPLSSAIGVAATPPPPAAAPAAPSPMKTIKLRRPTDLAKPAAPAGDAPTAPTVAPAAAPAADMTQAATLVMTPSAGAGADGKPTSVTQKKTLKLHRPSGVQLKRPSVGGLKPPAPAAADPAQAAKKPVDASAAEGGDVPDMSADDVADIPDIKEKPGKKISNGEEPKSAEVAGVSNGTATMSVITTLAAMVVLGVCTWYLFRESVGPAAGPNDMASFYSETDYRVGR